jgi:DNA-binding CsgD family transcriptional regulator
MQSNSLRSTPPPDGEPRAEASANPRVLPWLRPGLPLAQPLSAPAFAEATLPDGLVEEVLDQLHVGLAIVGPGSELDLVFVNRAARRECALHPMLRIDSQRLVVLEPLLRADLAVALDTARSGRWSLVQLWQLGHLERLERLAQAEEPLTLALVPLTPTQPGTPRLVLLAFGVQGEGRTLALQCYAQACGLTPAESRVLSALDAGGSPQQIARQQQVAISTVRTQICSIRVKTGARSITDLVRMLRNLPPLMPPVGGTD